jgi:hypothetical protein
MRRWFLSFNSSDRALAERLKVSIERRGSGSRVFFDATSLRAGGYWQPALAKGIDEADAFVLLVGEKGLGPWQTLEYYEAHDKHVKSPEFPVVLMLLDGHAAPGLPFLRQLHWIVTADPTSEKDVARLIDAAAGTGAQVGELWRYTSPYRGLSAMEEKDADYFFGRERETINVAYAGDIIGLVNPGQFAIGDTLHSGAPVRFLDLPRFPAEHFGRVRLQDQRYKQFDDGLQQLEEEGLMQVFFTASGRREPIVGVVGALQFDVITSRLRTEYSVEVVIEPTSYAAARWLADPAQAIPSLGGGAAVAADRLGRRLILFASEWEVQYFERQHPTVTLLAESPVTPT